MFKFCFTERNEVYLLSNLETPLKTAKRPIQQPRAAAFQFFPQICIKYIHLPGKIFLSVLCLNIILCICARAISTT